MFCRSISSFIFLFLAVVLATVHNDSRSIIESDSEVTVHRLTTENTVSPTREADQEVRQTLAVDLGALLDAGDDAMVTLAAGDTRLLAHRAVLTARSPVFAAMLQSTVPPPISQVDMPAVEGPVLRQLLTYLYTGQAPQLPGMAPQLLAVADDYGLPTLKAQCERQVAAQLSVETAAATAVLAVRHSSSSLTQAAVAFIKANIFHVLATQGWRDAMKTQPEILTNVMSLLSHLPVETSTPPSAESGAAATATQPDSGRGEAPTSAAQPATSRSTVPSDDAVSPASSTAPADRADTVAAQPHSDRNSCGPCPSSAAPPTPACPTLSPECAAVCPLLSLSAYEKGRRLREAAAKGAVEEVGALLAVGADVGARDGDRWTALHWAAEKGHLEAARRLQAAGAAADARSGWQALPLHYAAREGSRAVVRLLAAASADVSARDKDGWTPLHYAAKYGKADAATVLLEAGANKAVKGNYGRTPLDVAREYSRQQLVDIIRSH